MLEGLDQIEWSSLQHPYGPGEYIPQAIRDLLSVDRKVRWEAWYFLFGSIHRMEIGSSTAVIIPFIVEFIRRNRIDPEEAAYFLAGISYRIPHRHEFADITNLHRQPTLISTYEALVDGVHQFLEFVQHDNPRVRHYSLSLLSCLSSEAQVIVPILMQQFHTRDNEIEQANLLDAIDTLFQHAYGLDRETKFAFLLDIYHQNKVSHTIRTKVAIKLLKSKYKEQLSSNVIDEVVIAIFRKHKGFGFDYDVPKDKNDFVYMLCALDVSVIARVISSLLLTDDEVQLLVRALLLKTFSGHVDGGFCVGKRQYQTTNTADSTFQYTIYPAVKFPLLPKQKENMLILLELDRFWEIQTNLLSFFYGLPDSREEVRKLVELRKP